MVRVDFGNELLRGPEPAMSEPLPLDDVLEPLPDDDELDPLSVLRERFYAASEALVLHQVGVPSSSWT